ncbi:unnamed protein product [Mycena citricolor]|uniref:Exoribonuclease phosphorolytic domain-containing protein n=1 Tax=Mycena citricolor TaxID=2018698 RepID=A0AAD2HKK8_9AGAR|nr:unnamed protein product [Mycena citricolor]
MASNFDRRRNNGPEESFSPVYDSDATGWTSGNTRKSRGPSDIRPIFLQPGLISQANGSAYIETQNTKIACAIYGPRQSKNTAYSEMGRLNVEVKFAPFSCTKRRAPLRDAEDRTVGMAIHQALAASVRLDLLPKSTIDVFVHVIECDGLAACAASGAVAASTALADAGVEMLGVVTSCAASMIGSEIWLDPTEAEASASSGIVVLFCMPALGKITNIWQTGRLKVEDALAVSNLCQGSSHVLILQCMEACQEKCTEIHSVVAQALVENVRP